MTYPYVASPEKLKSLLIKMANEVGIPNRFDTKFIKSLSFTSSNDVRLLSAIKFVGLADDNGKPTELWTELRVNGKSAIAKGVRQGYADLFAHYADAHVKDDEALRSFFSAQTTVGAQAITKMISTFKAFCSLADFESVSSGAPESPKPPAANPKTNQQKPPPLTTPNDPSAPVVNINIQLQVPPDTTGDLYDKFFEAMHKHLWPSK